MAVEKMHPVVVSITTSLTRWILFEARSVKPFSIDEEILGPAEQGGLLRRAEAFESGKFPARWPINFRSGFFLFSLNEDRGSPLILHMSGASLQQDLLPLSSCQVEEVALLLLPLLPDDLEELAAVVGRNSNGVGREFL